MSEYQYYEFVAIDRSITKEEMAELRSCSSRATITTTGFVNEYNWGDLKANPAKWMRRYFDAFVYTANWCSCRFALRLPYETFSKADLTRFATAGSLTIDDAGTHWIIYWSLSEGQNYERFDRETGQGWMGRLMPLRDELLRGDLRSLYLGWLAGVTADEVHDNIVEPELLRQMSGLSAAQQALVEFLEIDPDLVTAAAIGKEEPEDWHDDDSVEIWVAGLPKEEVRIVFNLLLQGASAQAERRVKSEFFAWQRENGSSESSPRKERKVSELWVLAKQAEKLRLEHQEKERAKQEAERRKQRKAYLRTLVADFGCHWKVADQHAERGIASGYDEAKRIIFDLAEAYTLVSDQNAFDDALCGFMQRHAKRKALVHRLVDSGLWRK